MAVGNGEQRPGESCGEATGCTASKDGRIPARMGVTSEGDLGTASQATASTVRFRKADLDRSLAPLDRISPRSRQALACRPHLGETSVLEEAAIRDTH